MAPNVLSLKGIVTRVTPWRFREWFYVQVLRTPRQTHPVSSVHSLSLRASSLRKHAASNDLNVEYVRFYEGARAVRSRLGIVG